MKISKELIAGAIKLLKGVGMKSVNYGLLYSEGELIARSENMGVKMKLGVQDKDMFIIPPKALTMIENMPGGDIEITCKGTALTVAQGKIRSTFETMEAVVFPELPEIERNEEFRIDGFTFISAVKKVAYAAAQSESRKPILGSIYIDISGGKADFVATDSWRVATYTADVEGEDFNIAIPRDAALKACEMIAEDTELVIYKSDRAAELVTDRFTIYTQLQSGEYLDYKKVLQGIGGHEVKVKRHEIEAALKRVSVIIPAASKAGNITPCKCRFTNTELKLGATGDRSDYTESLEIYGEADVKIGFNTNYLIDAVKALSDATVFIKVSTPTAPIRIRDSISSAVVLPVRLYGE